MAEKTLKGRYRLLEILGRGGVATVYKAKDEILDRAVAVKILNEKCTRDAAFVERFKREAKAAAGVRHPNVVTVFDSGDEGESHFIVMEYVEGRTLKELLADGALSHAKAARIAVQIARALAHAHRSGIIHRDVKPQNVIIANDGVVKIADFGISKVQDQPGLTQTGKVLGTAEYISPEQAIGRMADEKSDMYSFGVVLFEMLTGTPPFSGKNPVEVAALHATCPPPKAVDLNPKVPKGISALVERLLSKDPAERPSGFEVIIEELLPWTGDDEITQTLPVKPRLDSRLVFKAAAGIAAALAVSAVFLMAGRKPLEKPSTAGKKIESRLVHLNPVSITDFDPEGNGAERSDEVAFAADSNPQTAWHTEGYANENFGNLKKGVGLLADFGGKRSVREIEITSLSPGWSAEIKGSNDARVWSTLSKTQNAPVDYTFKVKGEYRYYLLWITKLTEVPGWQGFRVGIGEIDFRG